MEGRGEEDHEEEHQLPHVYQDDGYVVGPDELIEIPSVIRLRHPNGGELFILGTAHVSEKSAADVKRAVHICKVFLGRRGGALCFSLDTTISPMWSLWSCADHVQGC